MAAATIPSREQAFGMMPLVVLLFFVWGFTTVLNDTLIPRLKSIFALSFTQVMLTQFCFFMAYFILSVPAGYLVSRIGYLRGIVVGVGAMGAGCLIFVPAAWSGAFGGFLAALFVIAGGIAVLQVVANPLISILGSPETASSRLTLAQAFNSLGTMTGPFVGSALLLSGGLASSDKTAEIHAVAQPYALFGLCLLALSAVFWRLRNLGGAALHPPVTARRGFALLAQPKLMLGAVSIFAYVGAEVSIGSHLVSYLMLGNKLAVTASTAGYVLSFYWGGSMVGRFAGSWVLTRVSPGGALTASAVTAAVLAVISAGTAGMVAVVAILAVGLFNAIQFPTIYTLAIADLGDDKPEGAGILGMAIVGGAVVPVITGMVADSAGISVALAVPTVCYLVIAAYGLAIRFGLLDGTRIPQVAE